MCQALQQDLQHRIDLQDASLAKANKRIVDLGTSVQQQSIWVQANTQDAQSFDALGTAQHDREVPQAEVTALHARLDEPEAAQEPAQRLESQLKQQFYPVPDAVRDQLDMLALTSEHFESISTRMRETLLNLGEDVLPGFVNELLSRVRAASTLSLLTRQALVHHSHSPIYAKLCRFLIFEGLFYSIVTSHCNRK